MPNPRDHDSKGPDAKAYAQQYIRAIGGATWDWAAAWRPRRAGDGVSAVALKERDQMLSDPTVLILMYFVLPIWLLAGFADWLCHRAAKIETTAGPKESLIHLLMFAEAGAPLILALFFEVNALVIAVMIAAFFIHEATALWDVSYATSTRVVTPIEQHVHSFLEMIPLTAILCVISLHWGQFVALFGFGAESARFGLAPKPQSLPVAYIASVLTAILLFELLPYLEELVRGLKANSGRLVPQRDHYR